MLDWKLEIRSRLAGLKLEPAREAEIVDEMAQHLEDRYAELRTAGATDEQASRVLLAELSERERRRRELRRVERIVSRGHIVLGSNTGGNMLEVLWQDLRYGLRML